jgi:flagellar hook assembly protein FlgD
MPYVLATDTPVTIDIYDVQGQLVRQLNLGMQQPGSYLSRRDAAYWDGKDQVGHTVSSGLYFYTLNADTFQATRRMVILK